MPSQPIMSDLQVCTLGVLVGIAGAFCGIALATVFYQVMH